MGANRPLAGRRSVAVLTVHGTLRAAGSAPPRSHPRSGRRIPGSRPSSVGRGRYRSGRRAVKPGSGGERACSLPRLPTLLVFAAATRVESNSRFSHSLQTQLLLRLPRQTSWNLGGLCDNLLMLLIFSPHLHRLHPAAEEVKKVSFGTCTLGRQGFVI
uniref:Uncharacterized protein n=1 Tax=Rousettus aegyptiacus TaxID=9407 RepID=A0A7J8E894_ROUAE|nr:hypothetical protein HJG63_008145 [Rousettus aegyptiacus]